MTGLYLAGGVGTGKSTLAVWAGCELIRTERVERALFLALPDLLDQMRSAYGQHGEHATADQVLGLARTVPLLILDDLGAERVTAWTAERLEALVYARHGNPALYTIYTSNLELEALERYMARANEPDQARRICARIGEDCGGRQIVMKGVIRKYG